MVPSSSYQDNGSGAGGANQSGRFHGTQSNRLITDWAQLPESNSDRRIDAEAILAAGVSYPPIKKRLPNGSLRLNCFLLVCRSSLSASTSRCEANHGQAEDRKPGGLRYGTAATAVCLTDKDVAVVLIVVVNAAQGQSIVGGISR